MDVFHANEGEILLNGVKFDPSKHQIGYLPEERGLYPKRTVMDQMIFLANLRGMKKADAKTNAMKWLKRLEVEEYATRKLETLSKGNQQKVQLAATLVTDPEIVILDEPFSGLDPVNSQILQEVVKELIASGKIVIFSSHQMSYVEEFCEDIVVINHGNVVLNASESSTANYKTTIKGIAQFDKAITAYADFNTSGRIVVTNTEVAAPATSTTSMTGSIQTAGGIITSSNLYVGSDTQGTNSAGAIYTKGGAHIDK